MTIHKADNNNSNIEATTNNIDSWCQKVLDLLDFTFADYLDLHGTFGKLWLFPWFMNISTALQLTFRKFPLFLQTKEEIGGQLMKLVDFMEYSRYFQEIYPSQGTQAMLTQETKKVWTLQLKPSHAKGAKHVEQLEEQHRQDAAVQPYPVIT